MLISVIIPTLNEEKSLPQLLKRLSEIKEVGQIIIADCGSVDNTLRLSECYGAEAHQAPRGRGSQLRVGAKKAIGEILWFIHADAIPAKTAGSEILACLNNKLVIGGNLSIVFSGQGYSSHFLNWLYPKLSVIGLRYGDSAFFVRKSAYEKVGGFRGVPIFEDLDLLSRLKREGAFITLPVTISVSARRFGGSRFIWVFALWCVLQVGYWVGVSPMLLAKLYAHKR
jgi:rSAM/selenodomain-associated transferase 2